MSKKRKNLPPRTAPTTKEKRKLKKDALSTYFIHHIGRCGYSENSGVRISQPNKANICHIFPKSNHPSVQANLDNCIYLTLDEHTQLDQWLFKHMFDKVEQNMPRAWELIKQRIAKVAPLVEEKTRFYFAILDYIDERNF